MESPWAWGASRAAPLCSADIAQAGTYGGGRDLRPCILLPTRASLDDVAWARILCMHLCQRNFAAGGSLPLARDGSRLGHFGRTRLRILWRLVPGHNAREICLRPVRDVMLAAVQVWVFPTAHLWPRTGIEPTGSRWCLKGSVGLSW